MSMHCVGIQCCGLSVVVINCSVIASSLHIINKSIHDFDSHLV